MLRVLIAGVTGWTGAPLARAVAAAPDLELAGGVARRGGDYASVAEALAAVPADVVVDYTSAAAVLATADERLIVRHEAGSSAEPYVAGTLLAIRRVPEVTGVLRGLDRLLFG